MSWIYNNDLPWDGTKLLNFEKSNIIYEIKDPNTKKKYLKINYNNFNILCMYRIIKDTSPCIYDEIMAIFNIPKIGTHYVYIGKKIYQLLNIRTFYNTIKSETILSKVDKSLINENFKSQIRNIYIIRDAIGLKTNDGDIILRIPNNNINNFSPSYAVGMKTYITNSELYYYNESTITEKAKTNWFSDKKGKEYDIRYFSRSIFSIPKTENDIPSYISQIRIKIENIIKRIDRSFDFLSGLIITRIHDRLMLMFN